MDRRSRITRRQFLIGGGIVTSGLLIGHMQRVIGYAVRPSANAPVVSARVYCPLIIVDKQGTPAATPSATVTPSATATPSPTVTPSSTATPSPTATSVPLLRGHVVHTYHPRATSWDFARGWYGDSVDARIVADMVDEGVTRLTRTTTRADAWAALLPNYQPGQMIGIKVSLNNAAREDDDNEIDALMDPINAIIRGLLEIGVPEQNIWIFDVTHGDHPGIIPLRFKRRCAYPQVKFASYQDEHPELGFSAIEKVRFNTPPDIAPLPDLPFCNALVNVHYLINMPIMKRHVGAGISLGFKNHFGSIDRCNLLHRYTDIGADYFSDRYSPLVDINGHPQIRQKTILTIGDGLFGNPVNNISAPSRWRTFGNTAPNSLFFSRDPVAIDCVMADFLRTESGETPGADFYLRLASAAGLGVYERGDPWGRGYNLIVYERVNLS
ncbi:MAG: DUF362 domain-containing protein [Roseiflexus sp.]|nr:DUF362 domain-containing protein [Roseiflexus sp.]MCS7287546.1 DUF362 domain-containing protein [Roseiflexus sp.]MDW8148583.1 DUF362 domain-containing protein [Roseiflexaceae bacterium]MDW8231767.1 DUF362 domain-containing protein [Roseiflexaceae bacterium]